VCARFAGASGRASAAHDVVLSSGFLAFAQHAGFLQAVEEAGVRVEGIMGTSAGALTGSLYAAGYTPKQVAGFLSEKAPIQLLQPSFEPWRGGVLSLDGVVQRLAELLPPTFEDLERDFAVGVVTADGEHVLIDQGPLPEAVAASAAIPFIFSPVDVPGGMCGLKDGGMVDRVGLAAWRQRRRQQRCLASDVVGSRVPPCLVHVIERSSPFSGADDAEAAGEEAVQVVRCPKSGVNFFDLGDFERQFNIAKQRASSRLEAYLSTPNGVQQHQQQQRTLSEEGQHLWDVGQQQQRMASSVVLPSARRSAAAAAAVATGGVNGRRATSSSSPGKPTASV